MTTPSVKYTTPTEVVDVNGDKKAIAEMLNERHAEGWLLEQIISHGHMTQGLIIYYFKKPFSEYSRMGGRGPPPGFDPNQCAQQ